MIRFEHLKWHRHGYYDPEPGDVVWRVPHGISSSDLSAAGIMRLPLGGPFLVQSVVVDSTADVVTHNDGLKTYRLNELFPSEEVARAEARLLIDAHHLAADMYDEGQGMPLEAFVTKMAAVLRPYIYELAQVEIRAQELAQAQVRDQLRQT